MIRSDTMYTAAAEKVGGAPSAQAWFAGGERVGYDPSRGIVAAQEAPLKVFLRWEEDLTVPVSFLPGFPDGSSGWAKVQPHLPHAPEMQKLFVEYVGMGDSDKPKDYAYSTAERTDLVEAIWRDLSVRSTTLVAFDFSSLVVLEHLRRRLQIDLAQDRLGKLGLQIERLPGGHLTTHEQPEALAGLIAKFDRDALRRSEP